MIYILLTILSSSTLFVVFKLVDKKKIPVLEVIILNYVVAILCGILLIDSNVSVSHILYSTWLPFAIFIGILFIVMFFVVAKSTSLVGISISTVANKMSLIIPIIVSMLIDKNDFPTLMKVLGIILALVAVYLSVYKKKKTKLNKQLIYLPVILFLGMGIVDALIKYTQHFYVSNEALPVFSTVLFVFAALTGFVVKFFQKTPIKMFFNMPVLAHGTVLGLANYGSIYFLIQALNFVHDSGITTDGSKVFGMVNLGTILLSVLIGFFYFKEKLLKINWMGILIAVLAIVVLYLS